MSGPTPAPLAQLRDVDEEAWRALYTAGYENPGADPRIQALAAALLGDRILARQILENGQAAIWTMTWPDLSPVQPVGEIDERRALDGGIFAVNTWLHPAASSDEDVAWLEEYADQITTVLDAMRDRLPKATS